MHSLSHALPVQKGRNVCGAWESGVFRSGEFHEVSLDEAVDFAVHHAPHVRSLEIGAVVLYAAVVEDI